MKLLLNILNFRFFALATIALSLYSCSLFTETRTECIDKCGEDIELCFTAVNQLYYSNRTEDLSTKSNVFTVGSLTCYSRQESCKKKCGSRPDG